MSTWSGLKLALFHISWSYRCTRYTQLLCCKSERSLKPSCNLFSSLQMVLSCYWTWVCRQPSLVVLCSPCWEQSPTLQWSLHQVLLEVQRRPTKKLLSEWGEWKGRLVVYCRWNTSNQYVLVQGVLYVFVLTKVSTILQKCACGWSTLQVCQRGEWVLFQLFHIWPPCVCHYVESTLALKSVTLLKLTAELLDKQ